MNDNDLERRLRSESGPREHGYQARALPMSPESGQSTKRGANVMRMAVLAPAVAGGILAVAVGGAIIAGSRDGNNLGQDPSPTAAPSSAVPQACRPADLAMTAEPWGAAAGSRGTVVTVRLADGRDACTLPAQLGAAVADMNGAVLATINSRGLDSGSTVVVEAGSSWSVTVSWSNWCPQPDYNGPLTRDRTVDLSLLGNGSAFHANVPDGADPLPPCNGPGEPASISVTELQAAY